MELSQHFQNYFELSLGAERAKLQMAIFASTQDVHVIMGEIDCRMAYLKGYSDCGFAHART